MNRKIKRVFVLFISMSMILQLFCGCQKKNDEKHAIKESQNEELYYRVRETVLPNPDMALEELARLEEREYTRELSFVMQRDTAYRLVQVIGIITERDDRYLQVLKPPYTE